MKRKPRSRSKRKRRDPDDLRFLRPDDRGGAEGMSLVLEEADALRRPVGREGLADDPLGGDWSPETAVVRGATVVAHHEVVPGWNLDLGREIAPLAAAAGQRVGLFLRLAVEHDLAVVDPDPVARAGHDALDEVHVGALECWLVAGLAGRRLAGTAGVVLLGARGRVEDHDVAHVGL